MASLLLIYDIGWKIARLEARRRYKKIERLIINLMVRDFPFG